MKKCPSCGGKKVITDLDDYGYPYHYSCFSCGGTGEGWDSNLEVLQTWNCDHVSDEHCPNCLWVEVRTMLPNHEGHDWEKTETLMDNSVEHVAWAYCRDCQKDFWLSCVELQPANMRLKEV